MPGITTLDWIDKPEDVVSKTFDSAAEFRADPLLFHKKIRQIFLDKLEMHEGGRRRLVPWVNGKSETSLSGVKNRSLVRMRCMIADELPQLYHQAYHDVRDSSGTVIRINCMFLDGVDLPEDYEIVTSGCDNLFELNSFKCVEIPGEADWVRRTYQSDASTELVSCPPVIVNFFGGSGKEIRLNESYDVFGIFIHPDATGHRAVSAASLEEVATPTAGFQINVVHFEKRIHGHPGILNDAAVRLDTAIFESGRQLAVRTLADVIAGDELAAEYMLFHLISSVRSRADDVPVGNFPLNLAYEKLDYQFVKNVNSFLHQIVPKMVTLSSTISGLNKESLLPRTDDSGAVDGLLPGLLQLSSGTHVIVDEALMTTGTLNQTGIENLRCLDKLHKHQSIEVKYHTQPIRFDLDVPVLVLSEGRAMVRPRFLVPITHHRTPVPARINPDLLDTVREYLAIARLGDYSLEDSVRHAVIESFVEMRRESRNLTAEDLHDYLEVARYLTISQGKAELTLELWSSAVNMERERRKRCSEILRPGG